MAQLTPRQIELVQQTWELVEPISEQAATLFYGKLFELDPPARQLFKTEISAQGKKLMSTLGLAVSSLTKLETIIPALESMGRRHADYGVQPPTTVQ